LSLQSIEELRVLILCLGKANMPMTTSLRVAVLVAASVPAVASAQQYVGWHGSLERAAEVSAKNGKPLFVVFRCER